jgi:hypothetical protein
MMNEFFQRAAECLRIARRTHSEHDKELFEAMARAFTGEDEDEERDLRSETPPPRSRRH